MQQEFSEVFLDSRGEIFIDNLKRAARVLVNGFLWGEKFNVQTIRYPENWIESCKERFSPKWLSSKFPVKYVEIVITAKALYPNIKVSIPREQYHLIVEKEYISR